MVALCLVCACPALAGATLHGRASVHDGDTIRIGTQSIRIWGIDAVELKQRCGNAPCGVMARDALADIIGGRDVICVAKGKSYQRIVATCMVAGVDVAQEMARRGMAYDYADYSHGFYAADQRVAQESGIGVWAMNAEEPSHWRACHLPQRQNHRPGDCEAM